MLQAIYSDVDFSDFTFTRHMLGRLLELSPERFDIVVHELREAWVARMRNMLGQIGTKSVLLWFGREKMSNDPWNTKARPLQADPLFITESMTNELRPMVLDVVTVTPSEIALRQGTKGMYFSGVQDKAASEMLGDACHSEVSSALVPIIRNFI